MRFAVFGAAMLALSAQGAFAATETAEIPVFEWTNGAGAADLCSAVAGKMVVEDSLKGIKGFASDYLVRYWVGLDGFTQATKTTDEEREKIKAFWTANSSKLTCSQLGFSVRNGHIWKLGVERDSQDFIEMALMDWGLTPNDRDCTGELPLDYVNRRMQETVGTDPYRFLKVYRELMIEYGAKTAAELGQNDLPEHC